MDYRIHQPISREHQTSGREYVAAGISALVYGILMAAAKGQMPTFEKVGYALVFGGSMYAVVVGVAHARKWLPDRGRIVRFAWPALWAALAWVLFDGGALLHELLLIPIFFLVGYTVVLDGRNGKTAKRLLGAPPSQTARLTAGAIPPTGPVPDPTTDLSPYRSIQGPPAARRPADPPTAPITGTVHGAGNGRHPTGYPQQQDDLKATQPQAPGTRRPPAGGDDRWTK